MVFASGLPSVDAIIESNVISAPEGSSDDKIQIRLTYT